MKKRSDITAFILAGGESSRMGTDKGSMLFAGKPMIMHILDTVSEVIEEILVIANKSEYQSYGKKVISDVIRMHGPAAGIMTGLMFTTTSKNLFISCDMPFINREILDKLIESSFSSTRDVMLVSTMGRLQPLCGIYEKKILNDLSSMIYSGERKMQSIINKLDHEVLDLSESMEHHFENINTPSDHFDAEIKYYYEFKHQGIRHDC